MKTKFNKIFLRFKYYLSFLIQYHYEVILDKILQIIQKSDDKSAKKVTKKTQKVAKKWEKVGKCGEKCEKCSCSKEKI